jgi:hypothetical protein
MNEDYWIEFTFCNKGLTKIISKKGEILFEGSSFKLRELLGYDNTIVLNDKVFYKGNRKDLLTLLKK